MNSLNSPAEKKPEIYAIEPLGEAAPKSDLVSQLNQRLASAIDLQMQMKQAHWNVKGPHFIGLHELFDKVYESIADYVDLIAERIVQLGGVAEGTVRVAAERSQIDEYPLDITRGITHVEAVASALAAFGREVRIVADEATDVHDAETADILTEIARGVEKWLWMVDAHQQAED